MNMSGVFRGRLMIATLLALACVFGCEGDRSVVERCPGFCPEYLPQTSPENVLYNVELAFKHRDIDRYCEQIARDFRYHFNPWDLGDPGLPPGAVFGFEEDSIATGDVFKSESLSCAGCLVVEFRSRITRGNSIPDNRASHEGWRYVLVASLVIETDLDCPEGGRVERVNVGRVDYYFRKGRTPEDSASNLWYIVERRGGRIRLCPPAEALEGRGSAQSKP
jgi:hypothetical protein